MQQIARQAEALQIKEAAEAKRQRIIGHVKKALFFLVILGVVAVIFNNRNEIQEKVYAKISPSKPAKRFGAAMLNGTNSSYAPGTVAATADSVEGHVATSLMAAQQNAAIRDSVIDQIGK